MNVDKKLIEHVAKLSRLELTEAEKEKFLPELKEVLELFSRLDEVDTDGTEPSFQPVELKNSMREDLEGECMKREDAIGLSEHNKDGYFKGPRAV